MNTSTTGHSNVALGTYALQSNTSASYNVGVGFETLKNTTTGGSNTAVGKWAMLSNTTGDVNTAVGENALVANTSGRYNTSIGVQAQEQNTDGGNNTAIGVAAIDQNRSGSNNAVLGAFAGRHFGANYAFLSDVTTNISNSVLVGYDARPLANNSSNEIVVGYNAVGNGSNTAQIGNSSITNVKTSGTLTAGVITYPNTAGTNGYYLKTDGSGTASWAAVTNGTVTSLGLSTGTTGTDVNVSGSPITSSGTITVNIPIASATSTGKLSSTDWNTFNSKQSALTLTTSGTSGAATLVGTTLNIPQYQSVLTNPVTGTGTTNYLTKWSSSSSISNSQIFDDGTNIGIGTITPSEKLEVGGSLFVNADNTFLGIDESNNSRLALVKKWGTFPVIASGSATPIVFGNWSTANIQGNISGGTFTERMRIGTDGNVGIGTNSPSNKLDVVGNLGVNTSGQTRVFSTYYGAGSDGNNIFIGGGGLSSGIGSGSSTNGSYNTGLGVSALNANTTGSKNTANGYQSLYSNTTGQDNVANGAYALESNTTGVQNTAVGSNALTSNTSGYNNTSVGFDALRSNTQGVYNIASGAYALGSNTTGNGNTANGYAALRYNSTATGNTASGYYALYASTTGGLNTANGFYTLRSNTTGFYNTALGSQALFHNTIGYHNTAIGMNAGMYTINGDANETSNESIYLGLGTSASASGNTNEIVIGTWAQGNGSNSVTLGNSSITKSILRGNVGIGTTSPTTGLHIENSNSMSGDPGSNNVPSIYVYNSSNSSSTAHSIMALRSAGSSGGNPYMSYDINGVTGYSIGIDNSDADKLKFQSNWDFNNSDIPVMVFTTDDKAGIGTASPSYKLDVSSSDAVTVRITSSTSDNNGLLVLNANSNTPTWADNNHEFIFFQKQGTNIGSVKNVGSNAVTYNTSSDYRLKEDFQNFSGLNLVSKMKVYDHAWKSDKSRMYGFKAHELQSVVPYLVSGKKDEVGSDGKPVYQMVDYSKLTPVLVKALQEQQEEIDSLKKKQADLEARLLRLEEKLK